MKALEALARVSPELVQQQRRPIEEAVGIRGLVPAGEAGLLPGHQTHHVFVTEVGDDVPSAGFGRGIESFLDLLRLGLLPVLPALVRVGLQLQVDLWFHYHGDFPIVGQELLQVVLAIFVLAGRRQQVLQVKPAIFVFGGRRQELLLQLRPLITLNRRDQRETIVVHGFEDFVNLLNSFEAFAIRHYALVKILEENHVLLLEERQLLC